MKRKHFIKSVEDSRNSLPKEFRSRIQKVAIRAEEFPLIRSRPRPGQKRGWPLGGFHGVSATKRSALSFPMGPACIVFYQKNIEAASSNEVELCQQIRLSVLRGLGHYSEMTEEQVKDVSGSADSYRSFRTSVAFSNQELMRSSGTPRTEPIPESETAPSSVCASARADAVELRISGR
jgi:predicted Zn-dependent protease with MMP-like domain